MKVKVNKKKVGIIVFLIIVIFICGNALAAVLGAPNVFFAISNLVNKDVEVEGKDNLLVDRVEKEESTKNEVETENETEDEKIENEDSKVEELTIQTAEELVNDYLKLLFETSSNSLNLLVNLEFIDDNNKEYETEEIDGESVEYYNTETKYSEFEDAMLGYMTKECIENDFSEYVKEIDDVLYISATGGSDIYYKVSDLELTNKTEEKYICSGKLVKYTADHEDLTEEEKTAKNIELVIVKEDDKYVVSSFCFEKASADANIVLYKGMQMNVKPGVQTVSDMEITDEAEEKYNTKYYNYENGKAKGETEGKFGEETYEGYSVVTNVKKIAMTEEYKAIPREYKTIEELPEELKDMADYTKVEIHEIDLDGDDRNEHVVSYKLDYKENEIGDGEPEADSGIILFDEDYKKVADLVTLEDGFWGNIKEEDKKVFVSLENVEYIDLDNDDEMEIIIEVPTYNGVKLSVIKYSDGEIQGEKNLEASVRQ